MLIQDSGKQLYERHGLRWSDGLFAEGANDELVRNSAVSRSDEAEAAAARAGASLYVYDTCVEERTDFVDQGFQREGFLKKACGRIDAPWRCTVVSA
jgi:hypothetical protein